jgi:hypothetical protein
MAGTASVVAKRVGRGLLMQHLEGPSFLPVVESTNAARAVLPESVGVTTTAAGIGIFAGAVAATVAVTARLGRQTSAASTSLAPRPAVGSAVAWSGFLPVGDGWISLALATREERERAERCIGWLTGRERALEALRHADLDPARAAAALQEWGIAAAVATVAGEESERRQTRVTALDVWLQELGLRPSTALAGVRVVDCGLLVSSPWASALLAHLGARVIAVAHPVRAASRRYGPVPLELDLTSSSGRNSFATMCRNADVVVDNFRPRVWPNLGFDPIAVGARRHLTLPAYASVDPRSNLRLYGFQLEACYGVGHVPSGRVHRPLRAPESALLDHAVGFAGAVAAVGALLQDRVGRIAVTHESLIRLATDGST